MSIMKSVKSSFLVAVGYDEITRTVIAMFKTGDTWTYDDVPEAIYTEMMRAHDAGQSIGAYFSSKIRTAFRGTRMPRDTELAAPR
jgi:hypothetical protein